MTIKRSPLEIIQQDFIPSYQDTYISKVPPYFATIMGVIIVISTSKLLNK